MFSQSQYFRYLLYKLLFLLIIFLNLVANFSGRLLLFVVIACFFVGI